MHLHPSIKISCGPPSETFKLSSERYNVTVIDGPLIDSFYDEQYTLLTDVIERSDVVGYQDCGGGHKRIAWRHVRKRFERVEECWGWT